MTETYLYMRAEEREMIGIKPSLMLDDVDPMPTLGPKLENPKQPTVAERQAEAARQFERSTQVLTATEVRQQVDVTEPPKPVDDWTQAAVELELLAGLSFRALAARYGMPGSGAWMTKGERREEWEAAPGSNNND